MSGRSSASGSKRRWRGGRVIPSLPPMAVPSLDTEHPGIRVIAEVASVLQAGLASGEALHGVVGALRRGLNLRRCRLWLRTPDGTRFTPVTTPGDEAEQPGYAPPVAEWMRHGPQREGVPGGRSEEHTSELQSLTNLVCRLLLEKKTEIARQHPVVSAGPPQVRLAPWREDDFPLLVGLNSPQMTEHLGGPENQDALEVRHKGYVL